MSNLSMFVPQLVPDFECPVEIRQRARPLAEQTKERDVTETGNVTPTTVRTHCETVAEQVA